MSYEAFGEPDDDYMTPEQACNNGWMLPDDVDELRDLFRHLPIPEPDDISKSAAAFLLIEHILGNPVPVEGEGRARYEWARVKLGRNTLI